MLVLLVGMLAGEEITQEDLDKQAGRPSFNEIYLDLIDMIWKDCVEGYREMEQVEVEKIVARLPRGVCFKNLILIDDLI